MYYQVILSLLNLSQNFIEIFFQEKIQEQDRSNNSSQCEFGKLYCRVYYHSKDETLYIESKQTFFSLALDGSLQLFHVKISNPVIRMVSGNHPLNFSTRK